MYVILLLSDTSFYRLISLFGSSVNLQNAIPFNLDLYNDSIKNEFNNHHLSHGGVVTSLTANVNGVEYKKDYYIIMGCNQNGLVFVQIVMIFRHSYSSVCFSVKIIEAEYEPEMGYYKIHVLNVGQQVYECLSFSDLKAYSCLPAYTRSNELLIILNHAVVDLWYNKQV